MYNLIEPIGKPSKKLAVVTMEVVEDYLRMREQARRNLKRTGISTKKQALEILGCSEATLYRLLRKKECKIRKGVASGTFITQSLYEELNRQW